MEVCFTCSSRSNSPLQDTFRNMTSHKVCENASANVQANTAGADKTAATVNTHTLIPHADVYSHRNTYTLTTTLTFTLVRPLSLTLTITLTAFLFVTRLRSSIISPSVCFVYFVCLPTNDIHFQKDLAAKSATTSTTTATSPDMRVWCRQHPLF